ncbi:hypothetical protein Peur_010650 [Populus x canadensis]
MKRQFPLFRIDSALGAVFRLSHLFVWNFDMVNGSNQEEENRSAKFKLRGQHCIIGPRECERELCLSQVAYANTPRVLCTEIPALDVGNQYGTADLTYLIGTVHGNMAKQT